MAEKLGSCSVLLSSRSLHPLTPPHLGDQRENNHVCKVFIFPQAVQVSIGLWNAARQCRTDYSIHSYLT